MRSPVFHAALLALLLCAAVPAFAAWNAQAHVFIPAQGQVVLYESPACRGEPYVVLQVGRTYDNFVNLAMGSGNWNDRASCVEVGPSTRVLIYQHINYGGSTRTLTAGVTTLCGNWWDNSISSARVFGQ
ncbi:MAG: beta/gamma crystallin domain-containing protein [Thermoanaerobaculia bacterium]